MQKILLYPIALFLMIFVLDKAATMPSVRKYGRPEFTPMENVVTSLKQLLKKKQSLQEPQQQTDRLQPAKRPLHVLLGTSRSDRFKFMTEDLIQKGRGLSGEEQRLLQGIQFETRGIIRASELFVQYVLVKNIVDAGVKPHLLVIELSPEMFNRNSPFHMGNQLDDNIFALDTLAGALDFVEGKRLREVRNRLMFHSYAFRFQPERAISSAVRGEASTANNFGIYLLQSQKSIEPLPSTYQDYPQDRFPPDAYQERIVDYTDFLLRENIMMNYRYDPQEFGALKKIVEIVKNSEIPTVFWIPYVHPLLQEEWAKTDFPEHKKEITAFLRSSGVALHDASVSPPDCQRFSDSSHLSSRCGPSLMADIQKTALKAYGPEILAAPQRKFR